MARLKFLWFVLGMFAFVAIAFVSFRLGVREYQMEENRNSAYTQAMLAFAHYKSYERIESELVRKCYEAALTEARELKTVQLVLVSKNLRASDNAPELVEYIKIRDPQLLETILAGRVPELKPYTTTCP